LKTKRESAMMKEFPSSIISSLESLFLEFNYRRLLFWVFVVLAIVTGLVVFENLTGYAYFSRMERKVSILKSLNELAHDDISSKPELNAIYQDVISELEAYQIKPLSFTGFFSNFGSVIPQMPSEFWKFISGGFLGFIVAIAGLVDRRQGNERWSSIFWGGLVFGILMGLIGIFIPKIYNLWVNYIGFPVIQIAVILLLSRKGVKK
jgi:hypothetical protein